MRHSLYLGKAGQFVAMSEFLVRGWNVAVPEVDVGDDIFVVKDADGEFSRVQVKTSNCKFRKNGFSAQFKIPIDQLARVHAPELYYVFVARYNNKWQLPILISRNKLYRHFLNDMIGTTNSKQLILYFSYQNEKVFCSNYDLTKYLNNYEDFPVLTH